ncbi:zinc metalloproteinase nas-14-like [Stylophora pistillata]|uniref:zinc metalloproteinase nas-14-like n=1 Tax=Stylophora pistillata TaxID=50429 RepID=UPI000C040AB8|nr:zinc metalloproteinase nas-14-like [Stylophora pistillata]
MTRMGFLLWVTAVFAASENPDENLGMDDKDLFEGDMILPTDLLYKAEHGMDVDSSRKRGAIKSRLWPLGEVPYVILNMLGGTTNTERAFTAINQGMEEWTTKTCIRFKRRTNERAYVEFTLRNGGCYSSVGRTGRPQVINLAPGCWTLGIVAHEIGHAIGFFHEQSRPDRDQFVTVLLQNVQPGKENNFRKYPRSTIDSLGTPYDYQSLMHYGSRFFSRNGRLTIKTKNPRYQGAIGQRNGLSTIDAQQANRLYQSECSKRGGGVCRDRWSFCQRWPVSFCSRYSVVRENCKKLCNQCS